MSRNITRETIRALREGDHAAFESVFLFYFGKVKFFIDGILKSGSDAEELAQEVFVKLWTNRESIDPERNFNTYVYVCARNATINFLRQRYVRDSFAAERMRAGEDWVSGEDLMEAREIELLVDLVLMKMPRQRKTIYEMNRREGLSNDEIALRLNLSKKTVENHMSLALREIKRAIKKFAVSPA